MNRFYKHFSFPEKSCSFFTVVLVLELDTPVGGKTCSRRLQLPSSQLSLEPPESSSPIQSLSCAHVLAFQIAAVFNSNTYARLPQKAGPFLPLRALTLPTFLFMGVLYYWLSSVTPVKNLECCQTSLWGLGPGNRGFARSQSSVALKWSGCVHLGDAKTDLRSGSILERNWFLFYQALTKS